MNFVLIFALASSAASKANEPVGAPPGSNSGSPTASNADDDAVTWSDLSPSGSRFSLYGFVRVDAIYDDSRPSNPEVPGFILSEDPNAPVGIGAGGENRNDFTLHTRLTRLGLNFRGPDINGLGDPEVTAKIEVDFYNIGLAGQAPSRAALRMRHGYLKLDWEDASLLAGQTSDLISPLYPVVNNDLVMWGAGNLGDRRPQIRGEYRLGVQDDSTLFLQAAIGLTGADDNQDLDPGGAFGAGFRDGQTSGLPTLQGRVAYQFQAPAGKAEIGAWGHYAWEDPDTEFAGRRQFRSSAIGLDVQIPVVDRLTIKGEIWSGKNADDVRGGIFQGINTVTGDEIRSRGGFGELVFTLNDHVTLHGGISRDDPNNRDLNLGGRAANRIWYVASRYTIGPVQAGLEYLNWMTGYVGFDKGDDNRIGGFLAYRF